MEVILQEDMNDLGLEGDVIKVAKGYARNYLIPRNIAIEATAQNIKAFEQKRKKIEVRRLKAREDAEGLKRQLEQMVLTFSHKAGEEGKLYGSVTSMDIASELENKGISIDRKRISMEGPIKILGEHEVPVKIYPEVTASLKITVEAEGKSEE